MNEKISKNTVVVLIAIVVAVSAVLFYKTYSSFVSNSADVSIPNTVKTEDNKSIISLKTENTDKTTYRQGIEGVLSKTTIPGVHLGPIENIDGTITQPPNDQSTTVFLTKTQVDVRQLPVEMISRVNNLTKEDLDNILILPIFKSTTTDNNGYFKISTDVGWYFVTMHGQENINIPGGAPFVSVEVKQNAFSTVNLTLKIVMQ